MEKKEVVTALAELGLTVESVFVPFSKSRNAAPKVKGEKPWLSLNWKVTIKRNGREVLTCDYSAGSAHCPGHGVQKAPSTFRPHHYRKSGGRLRLANVAETLTQYREALCAAECESGVAMGWDGFTTRAYKNTFKAKHPAVPILPDAANVLHGLTMDSYVLDAGGFEEWAADFGYDTDSRAAKSTYRACLDIALKMRAALGDAGLSRLKEIFQDY